MGEIKKIIWATDGSRESEEALKYAVFLAKELGSEIKGVHVSSMPIPTPERVLSRSEFQSWAEKVEQDIKSRLDAAASGMSSQGIDFRGVVLGGEPRKEIVEFARRERADLIVMGKRGLGLMDRLLVGSATLSVLRESEVPVLAVKKRDGEGTADIHNILVPLDVSEENDSALTYAIGLAKRINAGIRVIYVFGLDFYTYPIPDAGGIPYAVSPAVFDVFQDLAKVHSDTLAKRVDGVKTGCKAADLEIHTEVIQAASPSVAIADYASDKGIDLIVINTHGREGISRFFLGSVTEGVIRESKCPVLALKPSN